VHLDTQTIETVALAAGGVAGLSLLVALTLMVRFRKLRKAHFVLTGGDGSASFVESVGQLHGETEALRHELAMLREDLAVARASLTDALRHVSVVRYDAFGDMSGRMSFSAAMLDDAGDGLVLSSINGRSETRTYAKGVQAGESDQPLSPEEQEAIGYATKVAVQAAFVPAADNQPSQRRRRFARR